MTVIQNSNKLGLMQLFEHKSLFCWMTNEKKVTNRLRIQNDIVVCLAVRIIIIMKMYIVQKYTEKMKNEKWKIKTHMKWMS